ncbi:MAG: hypothetical protein WCC64_06075, partial [Aliidongia sp.]
METALAARITGFVATMRANGFPVGIGEAEDALRVAEATGILERDPLRWGWRGLLCARPDEWHRFDDLFDSFWLPPNKRVLVDAHTSGAGRIELDNGDGAEGGKAGPTIQRAPGESAVSGDDGAAKEGASPAASLDEADFRSLNDRDQTS